MMSALGLVFFAMPFVVMLVAGIAFPLFMVAAYNSFRFGIGVIVAWYFAETALLDAGGFRLGINLYYTDLLMVSVAIAGGLRLIFAKDFPLRQRGWMLFCLIICISLANGLFSFGTAAGVQARGYFYFMVTGIYAMSFPVDESRLRYVFQAVTMLGFAFVALTFYRWAVYYIPIKDLLPEGGVYNVDGEIRVIYASHALVLAQVLVAGVFYAMAGPGLKWARVAAPLLLATVLALQHRSVWLAMLIGIVSCVMIGRSKTGSTFVQLMMLGVMLIMIAIPVVFSESLGGIAQQVQGSALRAVEGRDTTGSRLRDWQGIIKKWYEAGPRSIAIGVPFGTDTSRVVEDDSGKRRIATYYAHNLYVQTLTNVGLVGLLGMLAAFSYAALGLYRQCAVGAGPPVQLILVWVFMQFAFYVPYGQDYLQCVIFGVAVAYVAGSARTQSSRQGQTSLAQVRAT